MCCNASQAPGHGHASACAGPACFGPSFWSKKKKIRMLEEALECLKKQAADVEEALNEAKEKS